MKALPRAGRFYPGPRLLMHLNPMALRRNLLFIFIAVAIGVFAPVFQGQAPATHPTSTPYAGDLSIFEDPGRGQRLQIDRVMDLLQIKAGSVVADIGAGGGWFSVRAAAASLPMGGSSPRKSTPRPSLISSSARSASNWPT